MWLDTNVVVRYIVQDDKEQARAVARSVETQYLIGRIHAVYGCEATATFDKRSAKSGFHRLIG